MKKGANSEKALNKNALSEELISIDKVNTQSRKFSASQGMLRSNDYHFSFMEVQVKMCSVLEI